jgi:biotin-[acetyl-CoA-carboxylase] ligase BirA-like protein
MRILSEGSPRALDLCPPNAAPALPSEEDRTLFAAFSGGEPELVADAPGGFWSHLVVVDRSPFSQFDVLPGFYDGDSPPGGPTACVAVAGDGFHGHRGRTWSALPGNLHLSVAVPDRLPADLGLAMTMLPAVAVVDAVRRATEGAVVPSVKWVNDILVDGRKIAGVLTTTRIEGRELRLTVFGVGVNVERAPEVPPTPFVPAVGCLNDVAGADRVTVRSMLFGLLHTLAARYRELKAEGPGPLLDAYRAHSAVIGREVVVWPEGIPEGAPPQAWPPPLAEGRVLSIRPDLSLDIEGVAEPVAKGRLAFAH